MNYSAVFLSHERLTASMIGTPVECVSYACTPSRLATASTSNTEVTISYGSVCPGPSNCSSRPTGACTAQDNCTPSGATS